MLGDFAKVLGYSGWLLRHTRRSVILTMPSTEIENELMTRQMEIRYVWYKPQCGISSHVYNKAIHGLAVH